MAERNAQTLSDLSQADSTARISSQYTKFVKILRIGLPLIAVGLLAIMFAWPSLDQKIIVLSEEEAKAEIGDTMGTNELLNPVYETTDAQSNPVKVTASRAIHSQNNKDIIRLENPIADFKTSSGEALNIESDQGIYDESNEKLFLQDNVQIIHERDYILSAEELRVNIKTQEAFSDKDVTIDGPAANIQAKGLTGSVDDGILVFPGPATLTLKAKQEENNISEGEPPL